MSQYKQFLDGVLEFWQKNVAARLSNALSQHGKALEGKPSVEHISGLYRIMRLSIET